MYVKKCLKDIYPDFKFTLLDEKVKGILGLMKIILVLRVYQLKLY